MKILYIVSGTNLSGGATKSFLSMIEGSLMFGHSCYVVCPNQGELYEYLKCKDIPVISLRYVFNATNIAKGVSSKLVNWIRWQRRKILNKKAAKQLISICRTIKPDIIHTNTSIINIGTIASQELNIPHIMHLREYGDLDFSYKIHDIPINTIAKNVYFIAITRSIFNYRKLSTANAKVIYNGICHENEIRFSKYKEPYILYAGRIQETKGIRDIVDAYIKYATKVDKPYKLKIAGDYHFEEGERLKKELSNNLEKQGVIDAVTWLGECPEIGELMYKATVTVVPSKNEGFGRVMPEAIANGCLVIGRYTAGTKEQIDNGLKSTHKEIALRYNTIQELANHIYELHSRGVESYYPMIAAAQRVIREMYTIESYQRRINNIYSMFKTEK